MLPNRSPLFATLEWELSAQIAEGHVWMRKKDRAGKKRSFAGIGMKVGSEGSCFPTQAELGWGTQEMERKMGDALQEAATQEITSK
jgi:hypothetical protein